MTILFDQYNMPEDIFEIIFATSQQVVVGKLLIEEMKQQGGEIGKTEMSVFATALHEGKLVEEEVNQFGQKKKVTLSYNKRQFYDRILTPMKSMGMIDYDMYKKTYKISDKFNKNMMKMGMAWLYEIRKPAKAHTLNIKK